MHTLIYWFGFLGAWLLVSGPLYQASVELRAEGEATARYAELMHGASPPKPVSNWWWLLPPVRMMLSSRRRDDSRRAFLATLSTEDLELVTRYINIARGWLLVALGAWLIALKESFELCEHYGWPTWSYWLLVLLMSLLALSVTVASARREREMGSRAGR